MLTTYTFEEDLYHSYIKTNTKIVWFLYELNFAEHLETHVYLLYTVLLYTYFIQYYCDYIALL